MRVTLLKIIAVLAFASAAISLDPPDKKIMEGFFKERLSKTSDKKIIEGFLKERLSKTSTWTANVHCKVIFNDETTVDTVDSGFTWDLSGSSQAFSFSGIPYSLDAEDFLTPIKLAASDIDSVAVNKSRTRFDGIMCWKARFYKDNTCYEILFSGDGLFKVIKMERKNRGKANSDDIWLFKQVGRDKDIPVKMTRSVEFGWGEDGSGIISTVELMDFHEVSSESVPLDNTSQ
ncbi:hypothetical protein KAH81_06115 [bacterium]|nr:hypothetical protein [bacterium]